MRHLTALIATIVLFAVSGVSATAQVGEAVQIDNALCVVEPVAPDALVPLLPTGTPAPRDTAQDAFVPPVGEPADAETAAAVAEFVYQLSACNQGGNVLAIFALQTEAYTRGTLSRVGFTEDMLQSLPAVSTDTGMSTVTTINDIVVLEDGRIGVSLTEEVSSPGLTEVFELYYRLVETDGQYLLDDYTLISVT